MDGPQAFAVCCGMIFAIYNINLFAQVKQYADPNRSLSFGETIIKMMKHYMPNSPYSLENLNRMAEVKNKINKRKLINHYKGQEKDEKDGKKKVRYHKHHHERALIWKVDKDGKFLTGQEIWLVFFSLKVISYLKLRSQNKS